MTPGSFSRERLLRKLYLISRCKCHATKERSLCLLNEIPRRNGVLGVNSLRFLECKFSFKQLLAVANYTHQFAIARQGIFANMTLRQQIIQQ